MPTHEFLGAADVSDVHTTAQLAAKLGLSRWSVSRALNGRSGISQGTLQRVRQALREYDFEPDPIARGLRGGRTGGVGICLPAFTPASTHGGYDDATLRGLATMERRLRELGYQPCFEPVCGQPEKELGAVKRLLAMRVQAVMMIRPHSSADASLFKKIHGQRVPGIAILPKEEVPLTTARLDEHQAAALLAKHLHGLRHHRYTLLGFFPGERQRQLVAALKQHGLVPYGQPGGDEAERATAAPRNAVMMGHAFASTMLRKKHAATVVIAADDALALGAINAFREHSLRVPQDCSFISYGNSELAECCFPALTSIDPQIDKLIERSTDFICDQLRSPGRYETTSLLINPILVHRDSVTVAPVTTLAL